METRVESRIYVGNLPKGVRKGDIKDVFIKYGKINYMEIKDNQGRSYAFIEFDSVRNAEDAVDGRNGYDFDGYRLRVEFCRDVNSRFNDDYRSRRTGDPMQRGFIGRRSGPPIRRGEYRLLVSNLPSSASWQDLKDHMREAGDVCYADVGRDRTGVVEFARRDGLQYAIKHLNESKLRSYAGDSGHIRLMIDPITSRSLSRSRSVSSSRRPERRTSRRRRSHGSSSRAAGTIHRPSRHSSRSPIGRRASPRPTTNGRRNSDDRDGFQRSRR